MTLDERLAKERSKVDRLTRKVRSGQRSSRHRRRLKEAKAMVAVLEEVKRLPVLA